MSGSVDMGGMRPMFVADLPAVGRLFLRIFRGIEGEASSELTAYLDALAFRSPCYDPAAGSIVFAEPDGSITSAMIAVPIRFIAGSRPVTGRLMCAYMTESAQTSAGAGALSLTLRAKQQDFAYADTASPSSLRHWRALGGQTVALQNLGWVRTFQPVRSAVDRVSRRIFRGRSLSLDPLVVPLDRLLRAAVRVIGAPPAPGLSVEPMTDERFFDQAPAFVARYTVRPEWSREELIWLLDMARQNQTLGRLAIEAVKDPSGRTLGCFVYYADGTRRAHILNVLALRNRETDVLAAMFEAFDRRGFHGVRGRAQPSLMEGLALQTMVTFRHEGFVCVCTRHADVIDAIRRSDVYLGGLAGEGWSRLMTDFG